ncbi:hypothetical protein MRB53_004732 [Persea americana]|uniref:Uncharacterized protein n=1 Tax=Persea americana TaxID=3435 RepID=A0ACC2MB91_PERAE|nr:hypothetical protein MRB53_004732 [Persea americana]
MTATMPPSKMLKPYIAKTAAMKAPWVFLFAYSDMMVAERAQSPPKKWKKHRVTMTDLAPWLKEGSESLTEQMTIRRQVMLYTRLRPILLPSQPKKSWPARVPQKVTPLMAADMLGRRRPGLAAPSM